MSIQKLAGQTMWYGLSTIVGRLVNYVLTPILAVLGTVAFGQYTTIYAYITFFNIIFTYGMETAYFRFARDIDERKVFNTASTSLLLTTLPLTFLMILMQKPISELWSIPEHPEYVIYFSLIIAFDTLSVIPFSKLRYEQRPVRFAIIKLIGIIINVSLVFLLVYIMPIIQAKGIMPHLTQWYNKEYGVGYAFVANMAASFITLLLLSKQLINFKWHIDKKLWADMLLYALPLIIVGFGGMVNETIDRIMIPKLLDGTPQYAMSQNGIYGANYKLAILIMLFIQAFRMGAEPFFLKQSKEKNAPETYARIMNLFVIIMTFCFLLVALFLDIWKYFTRVDVHPEFAEGLVVVPILLMAKIFLGIYYNLSVWYKIANKTLIGAWITIGGAVITIGINLLFIKSYSYVACAWASLLCYLFMVISSYYTGQKYYPIPYNIKKIFTYLFIMLGIYATHTFLSTYLPHAYMRILLGVLLVAVYTYLIVFKIERDEFSKFPFIGNFVKKIK